MENEVIGFAYRVLKSDFTVETYAVLCENNKFIYRQIKRYERVFDNSLIEELEKSGFKSMNYWYNNLNELSRDNIKSVKK